MAGSKISALTAIATVDDTDLFPVVDTSATTLKKMTRAQLRKLIADSPTDLAVLRYSSGSADWLVTTPSAMITGLTAITTLADADLLPINQSTTGKKVSVSQLRAQLPLASPNDGDLARYSVDSATWVATNPTSLRWRPISTSRYTPLSTVSGQLAMSDTSDFSVGYPVRYVSDAHPGNTHYGIVTSVTTNTQITADGMVFGASTISSLAVGTPEMVVVIPVFVSGAYGDGTSTGLLAGDMNTRLRWNQSKARLVRSSFTHGTAASTTQPTVAAYISGASVGATQLSSAGTWVDVASSNAINYIVDPGDSIDVGCTVAGTPTSGAQNLSGLLVFVLE